MSHRRVKEAIRALLALPYLGRRRHCPICGWHFRRFLPYGLHPRPNARCPRCRSLERHRLIWLYLKRRTNLFQEPVRLLHIAPEIFFKIAFQKQANIDTISADISSSLADVRADLAALPLPDHSVGAILCIHVLEHVQDDRAAMSALFRCLKPGGWAILQTPVDMSRAATFEDASITSPEERRRHFGQDDHVRLYGRDYRQRLQSAGFLVEEDPFAQTLPAGEQERYGIMQDEIIWLCRRPVDDTAAFSGQAGRA